MQRTLKLISTGTSERMSALLENALKDQPYEIVDPAHLENLQNSRILFACYVDEYGMSEELCRLLRNIREQADCFLGSIGAILIDGNSELYTKQVAQEIALAANMSGCTFPGKSLVEGTLSLYNQHILAKRMDMGWLQTYYHRGEMLIKHLMEFEAPKYLNPKVLMIHASDNKMSNTVWVGQEILKRLPDNFETREISLQNGAIVDCRGCSFDACLHFAKQGSCFYGGAISEEVLPAIRDCDAMLFLCPNYNDAVSANLMALFNRMTNLLVQQELVEKYLFGVVISGYSGSDLVARQLLGTMCFNKTANLPGNFCFIETAHDAGSAKKLEGINERIAVFAEHMTDVLQK